MVELSDSEYDKLIEEIVQLRSENMQLKITIDTYEDKIIVKTKPKKSYVVKGKVTKVKKLKPRIIIDDDLFNINIDYSLASISDEEFWEMLD